MERRRPLVWWGGAVDGLELVGGGVTGDGVRTVPGLLVEWGALGLQFVICLSPFQTEAESLAENWCWSFSEYSRLASLTSLLNLYFDSINLSLSPLLNASSFSNLNFLSLAVNQGLSLL